MSSDTADDKITKRSTHVDAGKITTFGKLEEKEKDGPFSSWWIIPVRCVAICENKKKTLQSVECFDLLISCI